MAHEEGRQIQSILDEALREYIENKRNTKPRTHVMAALFSSMTEHDAESVAFEPLFLSLFECLLRGGDGVGFSVRDD